MRQNILSPTIDLCRQRVCDVAYSRMIVKGVMLRLIFSAFLVVFVLGRLCPASETSAKIDIYSKLKELKPLPKVHYSWKIESGSLLDEKNDGLLYEYARITHALSICGESVTEGQIDKCVYICARINKTGPDIPCSIGINYSPWHRKFEKALPPTDRGPSYQAEIDLFESRMTIIKKMLEKANVKYKSDVNISALLLDSERFYIRENDNKWNDSIREALDSIHLKASKVFPKARIEWYGRGIHRVQRGSGWAQMPYWTGKEIKSSLSCSFYQIPETEMCRETFRRTCKLADQLGISDVTPWIALASGMRPTIKGVSFVQDWDYDVIYSYQMGAELNNSWFGKQHPEWFAPYNRAKVVIFFPAPFYRESPSWGKHFIAYVRGATGVKELQDLGFDR
jgi:hypothetical protein